MKFINDNSLLAINYANYQEKISNIYQGIKNKDAVGHDCSGWLELDTDVEPITKLSKHLKEKAKLMVVIGIGGSYLGTRAVDSALNDDIFYQKEYQLIYAGHNTSSAYYQKICDYVKDKDFVVNVISKSGMTLESSVGFRIFKELLITKYGEASLKDYIVVTTTEDDKLSPLYQYAQKHDIPTLPIPQDVGGRYSVFTAVGLLPLAFIDIDINKFILGAKQCVKDNFNDKMENSAIQYAINRYEQYQNNKVVEALVVNEPSLNYFIEWYKQLFAESEGKQHKGLLPTGLNNPADLHSVGQFIQDGNQILFETFIKFTKQKDDISFSKSDENFDGLDKLKVKDLNSINDLISQGVQKAHTAGQVPNLMIELEIKDEFNMGYLMMFMMLSCMYSGYLLGVNPFDQPGVELYKKEVKNLL